MKDYIVPLGSIIVGILVGYLGFKSKTRETKVTESTSVLKGYNELMATHQVEFVRLNNRIAELEDDLEEEKAAHRRTKIHDMEQLRSKLRGRQD